MTPREAVNWLINLTADIGKSEHHDLWHYEQALDEIRDMLQSLDGENTNVPSNGTISRTDAIDAVAYAEDGKDAQRILKQLVSAQPEQSAQIQDILQFIDERLHPIVSPEHWDVYSELHDMISGLSYAQPERKECEEREQGQCPWYSG